MSVTNCPHCRRLQYAAERPSFTCPTCGSVSYHPIDVDQGYCGKCHGWTRQQAVRAVEDSPQASTIDVRVTLPGTL